jgi:amino acid transporter
MFLVGSLDGLSSTFYAALSAIGFAISVNVFFPVLPIVPVAVAVIVVVAAMHTRGVTKAGNLQIVLGAFLLVVFAIYIIRGLTDPNGLARQLLTLGMWFLPDKTLSSYRAHALGHCTDLKRLCRV